MTWQAAAGQYTLHCDEYALRAYLDPAVPLELTPGSLGGSEHPFVWCFEVAHVEDGVEFRGRRESLAEAQQAALRKVRELLPDELARAVGY